MLQIASLIAKQAERAGHDGRRGEDGSPQGQAQFNWAWFTTAVPEGSPKSAVQFAKSLDHLFRRNRLPCIEHSSFVKQIHTCTGKESAYR